MGLLEIGIVIGGIISLVVAIGHCTFYKFFRWESLFNKTSPINGKVIYTIHIFLIPLFLFFSYLSFFRTKELAGAEGLALDLLIFYSLLWFCRGIWQIIYFGSSRKNEDQKKDNRMHFVVIGVALILFIVYVAPIVVKLRLG